MADEELKPEGEQPDGTSGAEVEGEGSADEDSAKLKTALHRERQLRREAEKKVKETQPEIAVVERLGKVEQDLRRERDMRPFLAATSDEQEAAQAYGYYTKLSEGITDADALAVLQKKAINLTLMDKDGDVNIARRAASMMHASSLGTASSAEVTPQSAEMARTFGVNPEKLKEARRGIKGLYNT